MYTYTRVCTSYKCFFTFYLCVSKSSYAESPFKRNNNTNECRGRGVRFYKIFSFWSTRVMKTKKGLEPLIYRHACRFSFVFYYYLYMDI